jgi:hypothetical protein
MSSKALRQFVSGALNPKGNLGDFQHAARLFVDSDLRLAPKQKFLYHVSFNINTNALKSLNFKFQHQNEVNMLVKTAELPKFTVQTETLNQYNRKKVVQVKLDYQPIQIRFHDDNLGVIGQLWQNYFGYYYGDSSAANVPGAYNRSAMRSPSFIRGRYGLDNNSAIPFFSDITIYQLAKKAWYSYKLVNPVITAWNHDSLDYSNSAPSEQSCTIAYESVAYNTGFTFPGNPPGFALEHYDKTPSPISLAGGGTTSLFGPGGVIPGVAQIFGSVGSGAAFQDPATFLSTVIQGVNSYQNAKNLSSAGIKQEATKIGITYGSYLLQQGFKFFVNDPNTKTPATPRDF